jgi:ribosomal protein S8
MFTKGQTVRHIQQGWTSEVKDETNGVYLVRDGLFIESDLEAVAETPEPEVFYSESEGNRMLAKHLPDGCVDFKLADSGGPIFFCLQKEDVPALVAFLADPIEPKFPLAQRFTVNERIVIPGHEGSYPDHSKDEWGYVTDIKRIVETKVREELWVTLDGQEPRAINPDVVSHGKEDWYKDPKAETPKRVYPRVRRMTVNRKLCDFDQCAHCGSRIARRVYKAGASLWYVPTGSGATFVSTQQEVCTARKGPHQALEDQ